MDVKTHSKLGNDGPFEKGKDFDKMCDGNEKSRQVKGTMPGEYQRSPNSSQSASGYHPGQNQLMQGLQTS